MRLAFGFSLGAMVAIITMIIVKPDKIPPTFATSATLVECKRFDQDITEAAGCLDALHRYLEAHPTHRIVGVVVIDHHGRTTGLAVIWSLTHGYVARDLVVKETCNRFTGGCPMTFPATSANVFSWFAVNDPDGTYAILSLRGTWDEGRGMVDTGSP